MAIYRDLTEDEIRKIRNDIVSLGQEAIGCMELGADSTAFELMQKQKALKEIVEKWNEWQRIKDLKFSDLI